MYIDVALEWFFGTIVEFVLYTAIFYPPWLWSMLVSKVSFGVVDYYCMLKVIYSSLLQSYEQAFEQIKEATGITDIDQLVTKFIEGMAA